MRQEDLHLEMRNDVPVVLQFVAFRSRSRRLLNSEVEAEKPEAKVENGSGAGSSVGAAGCTNQRRAANTVRKDAATITATTTTTTTTTSYHRQDFYKARPSTFSRSRRGQDLFSSLVP